MARPTIRDEKMGNRFDLRIPSDFESRIDGWRRKQIRIPSRAEAIRRLVEIGLEAEEARSDAPQT